MDQLIGNTRMLEGKLAEVCGTWALIECAGQLGWVYVQCRWGDFDCVHVIAWFFMANMPARHIQAQYTFHAIKHVHAVDCAMPTQHVDSSPSTCCHHIHAIYLQAKSKKDTLKARAASAKTSKQVQEMISGLNTSNAVVAFEKMEEKVVAMEAESEAVVMLTTGAAVCQCLEPSAGSVSGLSRTFAQRCLCSEWCCSYFQGAGRVVVCEEPHTKQMMAVHFEM